MSVPVDLRELGDRLQVTRDAWASMTPEQRDLLIEARQFATDYATRYNDLTDELRRARSLRRAFFDGMATGVLVFGGSVLILAAVAEVLR